MMFILMFQAEKGLKAQLAALAEQSSRSQGALQEKELGLQQLQAQLQKTQALRQKLESQISELQETITKKVSRTDRSHSTKCCKRIFLSCIRFVILDRMGSDKHIIIIY